MLPPCNSTHYTSDLVDILLGTGCIWWMHTVAIDDPVIFDWNSERHRGTHFNTKMSILKTIC